MASSIDSAAPTDIDQLLLDGTNAAHYTTAEWAGYEHLLKDQKTDVGTLRTPRAGRCWLFDGSNDYGTRPSGSRVTSGTITTLTVTFWVKPAVVSGVGTYVAEWMGGATNRSWRLYAGSTGLSLYHSPNGSSYPTTDLCSLTANVWQHVAFTYNAGAVKAYVNGVQTYSGTISSTSLYNSSAELTVGGSEFTNHFSGSMRDIRVYSNVKSAAEVAAIYNQASTPGTYDTTGLLGAWWCEEESGTTGYDWSGNGRNLTLTNITQATFHAADTGVSYSDANVRGYRLSGSVYIPATSSTLAADGNALTVTGKCPQPGYAAQKMLTMSGTEYISVPSLTGSETVSSKVGTSTVTVSAGQINFTAGTASMVVLSNGYTFPLCEGPGSGNTNRTVYGLKSDGSVITGTITNGTVATIWAASTTYTSGVVNWGLRYGYTVNGSGVIVPARLDGSADAAGNAIGQAAGGWASGLQNLNCMPYTNPLGVSVGLETSLDPTADRKTTSSSKRRRRNTSGRYDRFGARSTAMSDASSNAYFGD